MLQRTFPAGFIAPCLPTKAHTLPSGDLWLHEIKHDGFRVIARKDGDRVRLYSRPGNDMTRRFPLIVDAIARLRSRSCIIDGEAVACDDNGLASFERIRYRQHDGDVSLYAFDLLELNGDDLRRDPLQVRKATLASISAKARPGIRFNEHIEGDGPTVFAHACKMGLQGIVSAGAGRTSLMETEQDRRRWRAALKERGLSDVKILLNHLDPLHPEQTAPSVGDRPPWPTRAFLQNWVREQEVEEAAMQRSTLRWAQIAGWAGIAGVAVAVVGVLVTWLTK